MIPGDDSRLYAVALGRQATAPVETITLEGRGTRLVPLTAEQVDALSAIGLEPKLWQSTTIRVTTRQEMAAYVQTALEAQRDGTALPFTIVERASNTIVGTSRFHGYAPEHRRLEIGFTWISLPWQKTFVNTESKYLMLRQAFEGYGCIRVEFKADAGNEASRRALLRIGAKPEGVLRNYRISEHLGIRDLAVFSIIASEWPGVKKTLEQRLHPYEA